MRPSPLSLGGPRVAALAFALLPALSAAPAPAAGESGDWPVELQRQWVWTTFGSSIGKGGMEISDLDADGVPELVATSDLPGSPSEGGPRWFVARYEGSIRQTWSSLPSPEEIRFLRVVGPPAAREILVADGSDVYVHDGVSKLRTRTVHTSATWMSAIEVGNIDGTVGLEIVVCDQQALYVYDYETAAELAVRYGFGCTDLELGQTDADPALEIALAGNDFGGLLLDGATLQVDWAYLDDFGSRVCLTDVDHDDLDEIVTTSPPEFDLLALDPPGGVVLWRIIDSYPGRFLAVDVDGTGDEELVYVDRTYDLSVRALEETSGAVLWSIALGDHLSEVGALAAGDIDADGHLEIAWSEVDSAYVGTLHFWDVVTNTPKVGSDGLKGPFNGVHLGDMDGDGDAELVATSWSSTSDYPETGGRHLYFDPISHEPELVSPPLPGADAFGSGTWRTLVLQLDGDPPLEICTAFVTSNVESFVRCEDGATFALEWQFALPDWVTAVSLAAAQLDADPSPELVVGTSEAFIVVLEAESGWPKYQTPPLAVFATFPILRVGDVMGDEGPELVAAAGDNSYAPIAIFDGATGALLREPWELFIGGLDLAQLDADDKLEIVIGRTDGIVSVLDPDIGLPEPGPALAQFPTSILTLRVFDTNQDGAADFNVVSSDALAVWGGAEDRIIATGPYLGPAAGRYDTLWIDDYDLDARPELAVNTGYGFAIFEAPLQGIFFDGFESGDTSAWSAAVP